MKIEQFYVGERVRVEVGADKGVVGIVEYVGDTWAESQGEVVRIRIDGQTHGSTYVGSSLKKLS